MKKQTFVIEINTEYQYTDRRNDYYDFFRVSCKRASTAQKYLKGWVKQARDRGLEFLYKGFFINDATYTITETPDGYNMGNVVLCGKISELTNMEG